MAESRDIPRRDFILGASATVAVTTSPISMSGVSGMGDAAPLLKLSAGEAVGHMSRGEITVERYASALLERCRSASVLNAFITLEPDRVLEQARASDLHRQKGGRTGLLFGLPVPVKDSVNTRDYPTTAGTPALRHFQPAEDAPVVKALRDNGAIVLGKTNLHELSFGWTSNNLAFGAVHNPYDPRRIPGGSSGGTAVAIAAHMAPLGVAEDTEGSIRVPAALCGITGFRATTGRYPTRGCVPISPLFDQVGPHARTVSDLCLFDAVVTGDRQPLQPMPLKGQRFGIVREYFFTDLDPEVERLTNLALQRLEESGAEIVESTLPELERLIGLTTDVVQLRDARVAIPRYLKEYHTGLTLEQLVSQASPDVQKDFRRYVLPGGADFVSEEAYAAACATFLPALQNLYRDCFARNRLAAIVFPATLVPAPLIGEETTVHVGLREISFPEAVSRNIAPGSTAGIPGLVLPCGLTATGLPVAVEFDAPTGSDRALLSLGLSIERVLGPLPPPRFDATK
jgi:Asp-tRNA(Asn)/Glu-tRNA(Gln) amidotransferase A subunit family amidase